MSYILAGVLALVFVALWYFFGLFIGRTRLSARLSRYRSRARNGEGESSGFARDYADGLTSQNFDISINIDGGDVRPGLSDTEAIKEIMKSRGVSFDKARLIRQQMLLAHNNIDPLTGVPLDPKAVTFS